MNLDAMQIVQDHFDIPGPIDIARMATAVGIDFSEDDIFTDVLVRVDREQTLVRVDSRLP